MTTKKLKVVGSKVSPRPVAAIWKPNIQHNQLDICSSLKLIVENLTSSFKWRVTVSGELMFLESYGNCDVTNTLTFLL